MNRTLRDDGDDTWVCFVTGTLIETENGPVTVEDLVLGDTIPTLSNGPQVIRWIGSTNRTAKRCIAPIRIKTDALGKGTPTQDLLVSPAHRMLISGWRAELLFGQTETLVAAKYLVNDDTITVAHDLEAFEYFHILFDNHEIITSNGAPSESIQLDAKTLGNLAQEVHDEILALFPAFMASGPRERPFRPTLSEAEATLLH